MKKFFALLLTLCMALTAIPALGENDVTGTWYLVMLGMTGGTFEINADGTVVATLETGAEAATKEGSWTLEGDVFTLTIDGAGLPLTYDGTSLQLGAEVIAAFGGGMVPEGADISTVSSLIQFSREPGAVTVAEFNAYQNDGTIPEGKTKEDMDAVMTQVMMVFMSMMSGANTGTDTSNGEESLPLTILAENFYIRNSYGDSLEGFYIAKVQNENEVPVYLSSGTLTLQDQEGNEVGATEWFSESGSRYLEPGEISYVSMSADLKEGVTSAVPQAILSTSTHSWGSDAALEPADVNLVLSGNDYSNYVTITVTNGTDSPMSRFNVMAVIQDENGVMLDLTTRSIYNDQLTPGSSIILWADLSSKLFEYCAANNVDVSKLSVTATAWVESAD